MVNTETLLGNWKQIKGKLRKHWGALTENDLQSFQGNVDELIGLIQRKTGEARSAVEEYLDRLTADGSAALEETAEDVQEYIHQAVDRIQTQSQQAIESLRENYEDAEDLVRRRPSESVFVCFGVGLFVGLMVGLSMRER